MCRWCCATFKASIISPHVHPSSSSIHSDYHISVLHVFFVRRAPSPASWIPRYAHTHHKYYPSKDYLKPPCAITSTASYLIAMSNRPASLLELDTVLPTPYLDENDALDIPNVRPVNFGNGAALCDRCQRFDIQSFTRSVNRRCVYALREVEAAAANGCEFCSLLFDSVKDVEKPTYFYTIFQTYNRRRALNPDLYLHMALSENYINKNLNQVSPGLQVNRLLLEIGDRFSEVRNASEHELCLAADPGWFSIAFKEMLKLRLISKIAASPAATNNDVTGRYLGHNPASEEHYATVRNWIKECSVHQKCNKTVSGSTSIDANQPPLPARYIEISKGAKGIYLREKELQGAYITLTHRWNEETEESKTTTDNYSERL